MNIVSGIYIGKTHALFTDKRHVRKTINSVVFFEDGSFANLDTGEHLDKKADSKPFTMIKLTIGINKLTFGKQNENPQVVSSEIMNLQIDYDGPVEVLPSTNGKISVQENKYCYAKVAGDLVVVSPTNYVQVNYFSGNGNSISISNINLGSTEELPVLKIWAPSQSSVSGGVDSLTFTDLKSVDVDAENLRGNNVEDNLSIDVTGDVDLILESASSINIDSTGDVTLKLGNIKSVNVETAGDVDIDCKNVESLNIDLSGDLDITGNNVNKLTVEGAGDVDITIAYTDSIDVDTSGDINIESDYLVKLSVESAGDVDVSVKNGKQNITIDTAGDVTLILSIAESISVDTTGDVKVRAFEYLSEPNIDTVGDEKVTLRK